MTPSQSLSTFLRKVVFDVRQTAFEVKKLIGLEQSFNRASINTDVA